MTWILLSDFDEIFFEPSQEFSCPPNIIPSFARKLHVIQDSKKGLKGQRDS